MDFRDLVGQWEPKVNMEKKEPPVWSSLNIAQLHLAICHEAMLYEIHDLKCLRPDRSRRVVNDALYCYVLISKKPLLRGLYL